VSVKLRAWREDAKLSRRELGDKLRTDSTSIFRWELERGHPDKRIPTSGFMEAIHRLTRGAVTPNDFYDLPALEQLELPMHEAPPAPLFDRQEEGAAEPQLQAA
jgi:transcriptional regulator with XRE-family HTH domain